MREIIQGGRERSLSSPLTEVIEVLAEPEQLDVVDMTGLDSDDEW